MNLSKLFLSLLFITTSITGFAQEKQTAIYLDPGKPLEARVENALSLLTLQEKVNLTHAQSKFSSRGVPRLGIPELWTDDGPHGIRAEVFWDSWKAAGWTSDSCTAFPALTCLAATWNPRIALKFGIAIGEEARYRNKNVLLGPGVNIYRSPLNGRNFEYMGEDPFLTSSMVVPYIKGVQQNGVAACVKHFALNNQETLRSDINVEVSDRALNEIYLPAFKAAVTQGDVWCVMSAYNKFRGDWCSQSKLLLTDILKKDWGFKGLVMSDWSGVHTTLPAVENGLDLEMGTEPGRGKTYADNYFGNNYLTALKNHQADEQKLNDKVRRILAVMFKTSMNASKPYGAFASEDHFNSSREIAEEGIVLLKNQADLLPLRKGLHTIAVIGENAVRKMTVGGGSSSLKAKYEITPLEGLKAALSPDIKITYETGYLHTSTKEDLLGPAVLAAKNADVVVFFGGLSKDPGQDCEGMDRTSYALPFGQDKLIAELLKANKKVIVVLISGNAVEMPWAKDVPAIVQAWYGGSEAGNAIARVLTGIVNPSGKLPFTFAKKLADYPSHAIGDFPGDKVNVSYKEDILVGYRYFDTRHVKPQFAFGHGLSYTQFNYADLNIIKTDSGLKVSVKIQNIGKVAGAEVAQVYVHEQKTQIVRPEKELKGFEKIFLKPGELRKVEILLNPDSFKHYDPLKHNWMMTAGNYNIMVGSSSDDIRLQTKVVL